MMLRGCLWITVVLFHCTSLQHHQSDIDNCLQENMNVFIVNENYSGFIIYKNTQYCGNNYQNKPCENSSCICNTSHICVFTVSFSEKSSLSVMPKDNTYYVKVEKKLTTMSNLTLNIMEEGNCSFYPSCISRENCLVATVKPSTICNDSVNFDPNYCQGNKDIFILRMRTIDQNISCVTCDPLERPAHTMSGTPINMSNGVINAADAANTMQNLDSLVSSLENISIAAVSMENVTGILSVISKDKQKQNITFALGSDNSFGKPKNSADLTELVPAVFTIPDVAFQAAALAKNPVYVGLFRFPSFTPDEFNTTILNNNVFAIEMGTNISNLKNPITLQFKNIVTGNLTPVCSSWNGQGNKPRWTKTDCTTTYKNNSVICSCNHLTFFAILMSPQQNLLPNISSHDLMSLTYITYVGCGVSMFFLGVVLFMHFLLRRAKSKSTRILINLFVALFLLNLTFLSNEWIAGMMNNPLCIFVAGSMHYFMLSTFTWFAIEAFHLYMQLIKVFNIDIRHYMMVVHVVGWVMPFLAPLVIFILGQYGLLNIYSTDGNTSYMCWITNSYVIYIVNIGYYALVFIFTFTIFIIVVQRIIYLKKTTISNLTKRSFTKEAFTLIGLCSLLGITWGFAFFSYGPLLIPSYYIFTILNSFQGFFLFLYYYKTSRVVGDKSPLTNTTTTSRNSSHNTIHKSSE